MQYSGMTLIGSPKNDGQLLRLENEVVNIIITWNAIFRRPQGPYFACSID